MKKIAFMAAGLLMAIAAMAQPRNEAGKPEGNGRPEMRERPSVEQKAQMAVDRMKAEMPLTEKQTKKLLKFYKKDTQYRRDNFDMAGGPRSDGRPHGEGDFQHGGPGMGRGGHPQGGGPGGGRGEGMRPGGPQGERPAMQEVDFEKLEKYNLKQDKKLRKIIGDENFNRWRTTHPQEVPKLPDVEFK